MVSLAKVPRHAARMAHQLLNPLLFDTISINEYPKSGGTWVCRMIRDVTGFRFDDNAIPRPGRSVVKYHRLPLAVKRQAVVVRDPRDVFVSFYFHCKAIFQDDPFNGQIVAMVEAEVFSRHADEPSRIAAFVDRLIDKPIYPRFTWHAFYDHYLAQGVPVFRYEDFRSDPAATLDRLLKAMDVAVPASVIDKVAEDHAIDKILAARGGEGGAHFIRRGKVGGYADTLSPEVIARIEAAEGATMHKFGYL